MDADILIPSKMKEFEFLEHTADLKIRASGKTIQEAFRNIARGMTQSITDIDEVKKKIKIPLHVHANRIESLLYDFIDELIFYLDTKKFLVVDFEDFMIDLEKGELSCVAVGDEALSYDVYGAVKAPTYHEMIIKKEGHTFIIEMVLDV